jgi:hypothetical protein
MYDMVLYMRRADTIRKEMQVLDLKGRYADKCNDTVKANTYFSQRDILRWVLNE